MSSGSGGFAHRAFRVGIGLKAANAALELVAGVAMFLIPASWLTALATSITQHELAEDPHDFVATHLIRWAGGLSSDDTRYYAIYLLAHGVVKIALVVSLLKGWMWSYPASIIVLALFIVYQTYQFILHPGWGMIALNIFDLVVIWLIWIEYRSVRGARGKTAQA